MQNKCGLMQISYFAIIHVQTIPYLYETLVKLSNSRSIHRYRCSLSYEQVVSEAVQQLFLVVQFGTTLTVSKKWQPEVG